MGTLVKVADAGALQPGQAMAVEAEGRKIALFNVDGTYYAIGDECPHRGGPLSEGEISGTTVTCPWHAADFDVCTGNVLSPPASEGVPSYKVVVEGNEIKVEIG
jgi:nitrite reductase (NADH) small subunit